MGKRVRVKASDAHFYAGENFTAGEVREIEIDNVEDLPDWLSVVKSDKAAAKKAKGKTAEKAAKG